MLAVTLVFLCTLILCGSVDTLFPIAKKQLMGVHKELEDSTRMTATIADGTRMRLLESDLKRSSRVRSWVLSPWASLLYALGGCMRRETVVGTDGWLYLRERLQPEAHLSDSGIDALGPAFTALARRCEALGTKLVLAPVPDKAWVHPEHLPAGFVASDAGYQRLVRTLRARGLVVADLLSALKAAEGQRYMRTDTHWTPLGCRIAAECIADSAGISVPVEQRPGRVVQDATQIDTGDMLVLSGIEAPAVLEGGFESHMLSFANQLHQVPLEHIDFTDAPLKAPDLVHPWILVGTSFSASGHFQECLARSASERPLVRSLSAVTAPIVLRQFVADLELAVTHGIRPRVAVLEFLATDVLNSAYSFTDFMKAQVGPALSGYSETPAEWGIALSQSSLLVPGEHTLGPKGLAAWLPRGALLQPADGCLALLLEGAVLAGAPRVSVQVGDTRLSLRWEASATRMLIPLVGASPADNLRVALQAADGARVRVDSLRLMTTLAATAQAATVGLVNADASGFTQDIQCPAESRPHALALLELDVTGTLPAALRIAAFAPMVDGASLTAFMDKPIRTTRLLLPLPQETPTTLRISGAAPVPKRLVRKASVLVQSPRG